MKACIISLTEVKPHLTLMSNRICNFLCEQLNLPLYDKKEDVASIGQCDTIIQVNSPTAFCDFREELAELVDKCKLFIFVQNDYTLAPPSQVSKVLKAKGFYLDNSTRVRVPNRWTTVPFKMHNDHDQYINWNQLAYNPPEVVTPYSERITDGIFYYGAYRDNRSHLFEKYFKDPLYPIYVSSSARARKKYQALCEDLVSVDPMANVIEGIGCFGMTIYIEDSYSHRHYCSPASRLYECISAGIAVLIDKASADTLVQGGFHVDPDWVVDSQEDVLSKMHKMEEIASIQQLVWSKDYIQEIKDKLDTAYNHSYLCPMEGQNDTAS